MKRKLAVFLAALVLAMSLAACGGGGYSAAGGDSGSSGGGKGENYVAAEDAVASSQSYGSLAFDEDGLTPGQAGPAAEPNSPADAPMEAEGETGTRLANAKMIYTADVEAQTLDFDACAAGIEKLTSDMGGYMEYASVDTHSHGYRYGSYTIRVPADKFNAFLNSAGELSHITRQSKSSDNISEKYYDTESRLTTQKTKLDRLQALLARAENMEDIIALESAISETELQIEQLTGSLRSYDSLVDFSTIHLNLYEVARLSSVEDTPPTFGTRLSTAFSEGIQNLGDSLQDMAVFLAYNWARILIWCAAIALIVFLVRAKARKKQKPLFFRKKEKDQPKNTDDKSEKD